MSTFNKRYSTAIATFGGVDYTSQRFLVSQNRAINQLNFIYRDRVVQKRHGYRQVAKFKAVKYRDAMAASAVEKVNGTAVKGLWKLRFRNPGTGDYKDFVFAFVGRLLGLVREDGGHYDFLPFGGSSDGGYHDVNAVYNTIEFEDLKQPFGFFGGNRFWFLGGNHYVAVSWAYPGTAGGGATEFLMEEVSEADWAYVPTTTSGITYTNAKAGERVTLEPTNLLQRFRKNELLSGVGKDESGVAASDRVKGYEYVLDSPIIVKDESDMARATLKLRTAGRVVK